MVGFGRIIPLSRGERLYPLLVLSTLTLYDASLVVLRLSGLLDFSRPGWLLLAALFFVSGPGSWALAAAGGVELRRYAAGVAALGGLGVLYSALLTEALRGSLGGGIPTAVKALAGLTLLMMGVMELLLVDDAKRLLGGATRRCLSGIPLYIWPLMLLFTHIAAWRLLAGDPLPLAAYLAALLYSLAARPPEGASARCTATAAALIAAALAASVARSVTGLAAAAMAAAVAVAPLAPAPRKLPWSVGVIDRLVLLGVTAAVSAVSAAEPSRLAVDLAVYGLVAAAGWAVTGVVAASSYRVGAVRRVAESHVLRHAAGFALVIAGLHVLGGNLDPGLVIVAAAAGVAVVNTAVSSLAEPQGVTG